MAALLLAACGDDLPNAMPSGQSSSGTTGGSSTGVPGGTTTTGDGTTVDHGTTVVPPGTTSSTTGGTDGSSSGSGSSTTHTDPCPVIELGSAVPQSQATSTEGAGDDHVPSCSFRGGNGEDVFFRFVPPENGTYVIDTYGSAIDTVLTVLSDCDGGELACNDDGRSSYQSEVMLELTAGYDVVISVDSWDDPGEIVLNISMLGGGSSSSDGGSSSSDGGSTSSTGGSSTGGSSTGGETAMGFGDCATMDPLAACIQPDEICLLDDMATPMFGICALQGCLDPGDCPPAPAGGTAPALCTDLDGDALTLECGLDCSAGQTCPTGAVCYMASVCMWPA